MVRITALITAIALMMPSPGLAEECAIVDLPKAGEAKVCVSSVRPPVRGITYGPELMFDRKTDTAWTEGVDGDGVGQYVQIYFDKPLPVRGLQITNGYPKNDDIFKWNSRVRAVSVTTSAGKSGRFTLKDSQTPQFVPVPGSGAIAWLRLTIRSVYRGEKYRDTTIAEILVDIGGNTDADHLHVQPPVRPAKPTQ